MVKLTSQIDWSIFMASPTPSDPVRTVQASEAKTHFLRLLDEVEQGRTIAVTRHGRLVARLVPEADPYQENALRAVEQIRALRRQTRHISIEQLLADRDEGRM
jgi:prevent-host-death family protein